MAITGRILEERREQIRASLQRKESVMPEGLNLPRFKCHKEVNAAKITEIRDDGTLVFGELGAELRPLPGWMGRHHPEVGGYFVIYQESTDREYTSFSPAKEFEEGYTPAP